MLALSFLMLQYMHSGFAVLSASIARSMELAGLVGNYICLLWFSAPPRHRQMLLVKNAVQTNSEQCLHLHDMFHIHCCSLSRSSIISFASPISVTLPLLLHSP